MKSDIEKHEFLLETNKQYRDLFNKMQTAKSKFNRFKKRIILNN